MPRRYPAVPRSSPGLLNLPCAFAPRCPKRIGPDRITCGMHWKILPPALRQAWLEAPRDFLGGPGDELEAASEAIREYAARGQA